MRKKPKILKVFASIERNELTPLQEFKLSVVEYANSKQGVLFDIREFVTSEIFIGYSAKGVALTLAQTKYLYNMLPDVIEVMEKLNHGKQDIEGSPETA